MTQQFPTPLIVANWKMNGSRPMAELLIKQLGEAHCQAVLCPPAVLLPIVAEWAQPYGLLLGAQDCHAHSKGAYTGETSAVMLRETGCAYVILGHSERRQFCGESSAMVRQKAQAAHAAGLIPIICVGETLQERQEGRAQEVVGTQARESMPEEGRVVLAYEPVWAIGSGLVPENNDIIHMHQWLHALAPQAHGVLYGGSVNAENAASILALEGVDGALVGGASLRAEEFIAICHARG